MTPPVDPGFPLVLEVFWSKSWTLSVGWIKLVKHSLHGSKTQQQTESQHLC